MPLCSFRRDKSLRDQLVCSVLRESVSQPGTFTCGRARCGTCKHICSDVSLQGPNGTHTIREHVTCVTRGVVYAIRCRQCNLMYVGQTGRRLADRFAQHLRSIRLADGQPVARHFNEPCHGGDVSHLQVFGLALAASTVSHRLNIESRLIYKLGTLTPGGLNTRHDISLS